MWMWNSSTDCYHRSFSSGSVKKDARDESNDAGDCIDDCDTDTVLEMYHYTNGTFMELNGYLDDAIREYQDAISFNPHERILPLQPGRGTPEERPV